MSLIEKLPKTKGTYRENVDLSSTNWFQVGGKAEILYKPVDTEDLSYFLKHKPENCPITILSVGSNVIIRDGGIKGVVIKLGRYFNSLEVNDNILTVGAATLDFNVAQFAADHSLSGLEFFIGVPGSIGGAIAMNAGAYNMDTAEHLVSVEAVNINTGEISTLSKQEIGFVYRGNSLNNQFIFTKATFELKKDSKDDILKRMGDIVKARSDAQPIKERTGGSTFKNPKEVSAWKLIDHAGCRGLTIGGAKVSEKHCNFLINTGNATAADIENLGELVIKKVFNDSNISLEWEIKRIGEKQI
jgi:UDP-N-acetylmuramate dehydrogenase